MKIGQFLSFGHAESKSENENTLSPNVFSGPSVPVPPPRIFNDFYYILLESTVVYNWVRGFKITF